MTPILQTIFDNNKGDCLRACVASLLDLNADKVPNFMEHDDWFSAFYGYLTSSGYAYTGIQKPKKAIQLSPGVNGYYIGSINSLNFPGRTHVVIFKGLDFVHDPTISENKFNGNIEDVLHFYMIERSLGNER